MNIFTVRRCTQGLADYVKKCGNEQKGVVIAYDSRNYSDVFAKDTALVLAANGIKVYLYDCLHSVPAALVCAVAVEMRKWSSHYSKPQPAGVQRV